LTTKFTQHRSGFDRRRELVSSQPSASIPLRASKFYDPRRLLITAPPCGRAIPADFKASHKNLLSLVDYPIYSVVKHRPHQLALTIPPGRVLSIAAQSSTPIKIGTQLRAGLKRWWS